MRHIRVHSPEHVRAALAAARSSARPVSLISPVASFAGIGWWRALMRQAASEYPEVSFTGVLDCGPSAGLALAAIRAGAGPVAVTAEHGVLEKLADIALQAGTWVEDQENDALDLLEVTDPVRACADWLAAEFPDPPPPDHN